MGEGGKVTAKRRAWKPGAIYQETDHYDLNQIIKSSWIVGVFQR